MTDNPVPDPKVPSFGGLGTAPRRGLRRPAIVSAAPILLSAAALCALPSAALAQTGATPGYERPATEVLALLASCALLIVLPQIYAGAASLKFGVHATLGNREGFPDLVGWTGRARRAELNLQTNLIPFASVVLALAAFDISTATSRLGALLFLAGRAVHAAAYTAGIPVVRTLAFYASLAGTVLAASPLIAALT